MFLIVCKSSGAERRLATDGTDKRNATHEKDHLVDRNTLSPHVGA